MPKRPRRLTAIRGLLTLMLIANVVALAQAALFRVLGSNITDFDADPSLIYGPQPRQAQHLNLNLRPDRVHVSITDPSTIEQILGLLAHGAAYFIATLPMIIFARRLVDRAIDTNPFTTSMAVGLRRLGWIVLVGGLLAEVIRVSALLLLYRGAVPGGYAATDNAASIAIALWWLPMGLVILAFAQVIDHGCALRAELDEVI